MYGIYEWTVEINTFRNVCAVCAACVFFHFNDMLPLSLLLFSVLMLTNNIFIYIVRHNAKSSEFLVQLTTGIEHRYTDENATNKIWVFLTYSNE